MCVCSTKAVGVPSQPSHSYLCMFTPQAAELAITLDVERTGAKSLRPMVDERSASGVLCAVSSHGAGSGVGQCRGGAACFVAQNTSASVARSDARRALLPGTDRRTVPLTPFGCRRVHVDDEGRSQSARPDRVHPLVEHSCLRRE